VFGALIAPTDPIAVLGILKTAGAPKTLETKITGESLFNDGVAVVVFLVLVGVATGDTPAAPGAIAWLFLQEAVGGALFGGACGWLTYRMLASVDNYQVEVLITLALATGVYALAEAWHLSAPIAIVVAGLLVGNHGRMLGMSERTREHLDTFWELVDETLNAVLFLLIGMELLVLSFRGEYLVAGLLLIPLVLLARFISVGLPVGLLRARRTFSPHVVKILTWGGLRGGISVALALSLPASPERDPLVAATYVIVVFSIIVQGLTIGPLLRRTVGGTDGQTPDASH
jgi:CPA1 family monovalent cation:H+ antiporter